VVTRLNTAIQAPGIADVADLSLESPETRKFVGLGYSLSASAICVNPESLLAQSASFDTHSAFVHK
jgi:hypothetical protein